MARRSITNSVADVEDAPGDAIEREPNLRDVAYARLQQLWLNGTIKPQQWLSQRQLVELIDAPLASVRDALKRLEAEGLVVLQPKRGVFTLGTTPTQISEIYAFRMLLEVTAVGRAAERPDMVAIGRLMSETRRLYDTRQQSDEAWAAELPQRIECDVGFHRFVIGQFNNAYISEAFDRAISRQRLYRLTFPGSNRRDGVALAEHIDVLAAIADGVPSRAMEAMRSHLSLALRRTLDIPETETKAR
ncbi:GntR family transcriptional regulator [Piscinibacter sakaiensis]|uniref:GntR family transcriptional regulator n=1 Tax=Piscinibacter sakaiensis TaxID=1547922 RepID=UPI003AB03DCE